MLNVSQIKDSEKTIMAKQVIATAIQRDHYKAALEKIAAHAWSPKDRRPTINRHAREMWQTAVDALD